MFSQMTGLLLLAVAAGVVDFLGAILALAPIRYSRRALLYLVGMSGGYMLTWTVAELIPFLVQHQASLVSWVLVGYFGLYVIENLFASHAHPMLAGDAHSHTLVDSWSGHTALISPAACWAAVAGLFVHALFDGAGIVASFMINRTVGAMVFIAVLIHKIPEGSSLTSILAAAQQSTRAIVAAAAGTAFITVMGGFIAWRVGLVEPPWIYPLLALSAGTFFFIGASNLIPATQKGESKSAVLAVIGGALIFYGVRLLLPTAGIHLE